MIAVDVESPHKYQPPAEQASVPSSFRSALEQKQRHASRVTEVKFGTGLPSQFSVEDVSALPDEPRLGPSREQAPSALPWAAIAVLAGAGSYIGVMTEATRRIKDPKKRLYARSLAFGAPVGLACLASGIATEIAPSAAEVFTVQSVENLVNTWNDFHITDGVQNFHLNRTGEISSSVDKGKIVTAPFALKGKEGWVYTLADSTLLTVDINGDTSAKGVGTLTTPSHFLLAYDPKSGETATYYLLPQTLENTTNYTALEINEDDFGVQAGFQFIRTPSENGDVFSIWEDGELNPVQTPIIEQNVDTFVNISFNPVNSMFPTPSAEVAPTVMPTPTEVAVGQVDPEHPQAGARPEGADKIINNEWTKPNPENAEKPFVYKTVTDPKTKEVITQGWFTDQGGGPMMDEPNSGAPTLMSLHVWCQEGLQCPTLQHLPNTEPRNQNLTYSKLLYTKIHDRFRKTLDGITFDTKLKAGELSLPFITANGDRYEYKINQDTSANVYVVNWDNIKADVEWSVWRSNTTGDDKGNLNLVAAVDPEKKSIDSMSPREFMELVTYPYFRVIFKENQDKATFQFLGPAGGMTQLVDLAIKGENPYFLVTR